jgi:uncharacterized protein DUF5719
MKGRGQGMLALIVAAAVIAGGLALGRVMDPVVPPPAQGGSAVSGAWICPHGGGRLWRAVLLLANASIRPAIAHVTSMAGDGASPPRVVEVPPSSTVSVDVVATARESSTFVETFGASIVAGWVVQGFGEERGTAAEPCVPDGRRTWFIGDGTTEEGEEAFVIIANPFASDAVVDISLFARGRAPIRDSRVTDLSIPSRSSRSVRLGTFAAGEPAIGALVQSRVGRVGVAGLGVGVSGIRSTVGRTALLKELTLPVASGSGQATLQVFDPGEEDAVLAATLLSREEPALIAGFIGSELGAESAAAYSLDVEDVSAVELSAQGPEGVTAALRALGTRGDAAATAGVPAVAAGWIVLPAVVADKSAATVVLVNPGARDVGCDLEVLPVDAGAPAATTITVPARSVGSTEPGFLEGTSGAVVVRCGAGRIVALEAGISGGTSDQASAGYALSMGVPIES